MKSQSTVIVNVDGAGLGSVHVDGVQIKPVQAISVAIEASDAPVVNMRLAAREGVQLRYEGATLIVDDVVMPTSVELALWSFLKTKYERVIDVTSLSSAARERALLGK